MQTIHHLKWKYQKYLNYRNSNTKLLYCFIAFTGLLILLLHAWHLKKRVGYGLKDVYSNTPNVPPLLIINESPVQRSQYLLPLPDINMNNTKPYIAMIHIPKTAGNSFFEQYKRNYTFMYISPGPDERSYSYYIKEIRKRRSRKYFRTFTFFRHPEKHVYSMYLECKYDHWGKKVTKNTTFPQVKEDEIKGDTPGFDMWLKHFTENKATTNMYKCYQPANMQTRYMMSNVTEPHNFDFPHKFTDETKSRINNLWYFGLTEYYTLSTCVIEFLLSNTLSEACKCPHKPKRVVEKRITHGVPPHPYHKLSPNTKAMVSSLVEQDVLLYDYAKTLFFDRIDAIENEYSIKFCY